MPEGFEVVEIARIAAADEQVHARVVRALRHFHHLCPQWSDTGAGPDHENVTVAGEVDLETAEGSGHDPAVTDVGLADDRGADPSSRHLADVELELTERVGRNRR